MSSSKKIKEELNNLINEGASLVIEESDYNNLRFNYQDWYTKSLAVLQQLAPERLIEFRELYRDGNRKNIDISTYGISDFLLGYSLKGHNSKDIALIKVMTQIKILNSLNSRIDYLLSDIEGILKSDLFTNELESSKSLLKSNHLRAAGTLAGVVLESHLSDVCRNHGIKVKTKNPVISVYNDLLKDEKILDVPKWRKIQVFGDIRNYCTHKKERDPTYDEVEELIEGVKKIIKTVC